jgi:hypothetical protein
MAIEINNIPPIPKSRRKRKERPGRKSERQEAVGKLEVGQSFWVKAPPNSVGTLLWWAKARYPERAFTFANENDGVRIWRTK